MSFLGSLFKTQEDTDLSSAKTVLDAVLGAASLVSNPSQIDPVLDKVRNITTRLQPGEQPESEDATALIGVYLKIETYLVTEEPIRSFTKDELRGRLREELRSEIEAHEKKG